MDMLLTRNVLLNMLGGAFTGLLILFSTPWYVTKLGFAGYGVVGIWVMLQFMVGLLDMGIGTSLIKGLASAPPGLEGLRSRRDLLRTLEVVCGGFAVFLTLSLLVCSDWIALRWVTVDGLSRGDLSIALVLMSVSLGLQFPSLLYINGLAGLQAHAYLNLMHVAGNTLRYGGGAAVLVWRPEIVWFFGVQVGFAALHTLATRTLIWYLLYEPNVDVPSFRGSILNRIRSFSVGMSLTAICAVLLASADRMVLSRMVSTDELGRYAVAFAGSGLLQLAIQPFYRTFFPRYAELISRSEYENLKREYFRSCSIMAMLLVPMGFVGFVFAPELLYAWLNQHDQKIVTTFRLLMLGITCAGLGWLPAAFQQAHGWTRLHTQMMAGSILIGVPLIVIATPILGIASATAVWLLHGLSDITLGLWLMHRRLLKGELMHWYRSVLIPPLITTAPVVLIALWLMPADLGRWQGLAWSSVVGVAAVAIGFITRQKLLRHAIASQT